MHDFSQWLQSAGGMDEKVCVFLVFGALFCAIVAFINKSVTPLLFAVGCFCLSEGLSSPNLESEIKQIGDCRRSRPNATCPTTTCRPRT